MKKLLSLIAAFGVMFALSSCGDDDDDPVDLAAPVVTAPAASSVQVGNSATVSFPYTAAAGFTSSSVTATGGTATVTTDGTTGETTGTIEVTFTAGTTAGAGSVTLTVVDAEGDENNATAVITISASAVPEIQDIPATASVVAGMPLGPVNATVVMEDLPGTLTITQDGAEFATIDITTDGQVVPFTFETDATNSGNTIVFEFT
ncbi:MAG: hypothetical protein AAFN93_00445, partial [Bacteroidota bacterium]